MKPMRLSFLLAAAALIACDGQAETQRGSKPERAERKPVAEEYVALPDRPDRCELLTTENNGIEVVVDTCAPHYLNRCARWRTLKREDLRRLNRCAEFERR